MRNYHYLVLFMIGFLVLWPFMLHKLYIEQDKSVEAFVTQNKEESSTLPEDERFPEPPEKEVVVSEVEKEPSEEQVEEPVGEKADGSVEEQAEGAVEESVEKPAEKPKPAGEVAEEPVGNNQETPAAMEQMPAEEITGDVAGEPQEELASGEFFQDTLFIGDSRTMGLAEYADLDNAVVFANTGMNIYRLYSLKNAVRNQESSLEKILTGKQFKKIYLMLGINELGYDEGQTVKRYEAEVLKLRELQPDAKIILEANLHVTTARSGRDAIFNNGNINRINENIRQIGEKYGMPYIDVNEIFDDETGGLKPECTHDEVHVLGKYYQQWADWIRNSGI